jgi:hypothetical protein
MNHKTFDVLLAAVIVTLVVVLLVRPRIWLALVEAVLAVCWWPANNGVLEGPTLIPFTHDHGFTVSDLLGAAGLIAAYGAIGGAPRSTGTQRRRAVGALAVIALAGLAGAVAN